MQGKNEKKSRSAGPKPGKAGKKQSQRTEWDCERAR